MGCRWLPNYKHLVAVTKDRKYIDNVEFLASIWAYPTIPKELLGKPIDQTPSKYLDVVYLDIAFGDCMSVGGYKYASIFMDRASRYNWCFSLKSLHHDKIISAFLAFRSEAGNLACLF
jgi:hypothetical protein